MLTFFSAACGALIGIIIYKRTKLRPIIYKMDSDRWIPLKKDEFIKAVENLQDMQELLVTDGQRVDVLRIAYYDKDGNPKMNSFSNRVITHWMPMPNPPETKLKLVEKNEA